MYFKSIVDLAEIDIMKNLGKYGFCKALSKKLGFYDQERGYEYRMIEEDIKNDNLEMFLESLKDTKLYKPEQNKLIDMIDLKVNGRKQKSYTKLNKGLNMINLPYIIIPKKSGNERYWIVEKIDK